MSIFSKFLNHHANDLHVAADVFTAVASSIPLGPVEHTLLMGSIDTIRTSANNIHDSLHDVQKATTDVTHASLADSIRTIAAPIIAEIVAAELAKLVAPKAAPATAADLVPVQPAPTLTHEGLNAVASAAPTDHTQVGTAPPSPQGPAT